MTTSCLGRFRPSWVGSRACERLRLDNNQLSGTIPPELGRLVHLEELFLHGNQFTGEIPRELGDLASLRRLKLGDNQLSGTLPAELGDIPHSAGADG